MPDFTPADRHIHARALGVTLDDPPPPVSQHLLNTITLAYQRVEAESARAHQAERERRKERDSARIWVWTLVWFLAFACAVCLGEGWVIWRISQ